MAGQNFLRDTKIFIQSEVLGSGSCPERSVFFSRGFRLFHDVLCFSPHFESLNKSECCNSVDHCRSAFGPSLFSFSLQFYMNMYTFVFKWIIIILLTIFFSQFFSVPGNVFLWKYAYDSSAVSSICPCWVSCCYRQATIKFHPVTNYLSLV